MNWYLDAWKNYVNFEGRARRKAYWMFILFNVIAIIALALIEGILGGYGILPSLYSLAIVLPVVAIAVRRLHDIGKSGWWFFIQLVPIIGGIWFLILLVMDSEPGTNQYGPNPKEAAPPAI
jgi:uncharacterized membrane protein YhaH (DUF805 family)